MSQSIITTGNILHQLVIGQVQAIPEELFDVQPKYFNNTIRWNVGHIVFWMDRYISLSFQTESRIPGSYEALFNSGTKPSDWTQAPPSKEELIQQLSAQLGSFSEIASASLSNPLQVPFEIGPFRMETAGELFNFAFLHEGIHLGTISSILKVVQQS